MEQPEKSLGPFTLGQMMTVLYQNTEIYSAPTGIWHWHTAPQAYPST